MRRTVFVLLCLVLSCLPAAADDWLKSLMLFDAGRYEEALELLTPIAESGNLDAQEILYAIYTYGYGVPVDHEAAFGWLQRSAELGDAKAQEAMGYHYIEGSGVAMDDVQAVQWFRRAAQQGYPSAVYSLALMTMNGQGVEADVEEAWRLIQFAADLGSGDALYLLGSVAFEDAVEAADVDMAFNYLTRAAKLGQRQASAMLGFILEDFPEDPHHRVKSAFYYRTAVAAGCDDIGDAAAQAVARLSPDDLETLAYNLTLHQPETDPRDPKPMPGHCLVE